MSQNTANTQAFIEAQQYSKFILDNLHDGLLHDTFTRDVSDFGHGTTLNIKTVGTATLQEVFEEQPLSYNAIDTGTVTLQITDYIGDAWSISDVLRQDGSQIEALHAMRAMESTRDSLTQGVGMLTGEAEPMDTMGDDDMDMDMDMEEPEDEDEIALGGEDDFEVSDAAAGGEEEMGREKRESVEHPKKKSMKA